jgi:predicted enzyme related to lactoylglutathione lyase
MSKFSSSTAFCIRGVRRIWCADVIGQHLFSAETGKNRLHLDLRSRDLATAIEQALALGATRADDVYAGGRWQVMRDPEGNEFCLLRPRV